MAETTKASTGAKSQFWLYDGAALYQLVQVKSFGLPSPEREQLESTHLESDAKEFVPGDIDYGEFDVVVNLRPGSDTDTKIEAAVAAGDERAFKAVLAVRGTLTRDYTGNAIAVKYERGDINRAGIMQGTLTLRSTGAVTSAAHV